MRRVAVLLLVGFALPVFAEEPLPNGWTDEQRTRWGVDCRNKVRLKRPYLVAAAFCDCLLDKLVLPRFTHEAALGITRDQERQIAAEAWKVCAEDVRKVERVVNGQITGPDGKPYDGRITHAPNASSTYLGGWPKQTSEPQPASPVRQAPVIQLREWGKWFAEQCMNQGNGDDVCKCAAWMIEGTWEPKLLQIYREGYRDANVNRSVTRTIRECTPGY